MPVTDCTLPQLLLGNRERWGTQRIALRTKERGIWSEYSWNDCWERTRTIFLGLRCIGLKAGTRVCILGRNSPEWLYCELAVQAARGVLSGIDEEWPPDDTAALMGSMGVDLAFAEDQEQVDKLLEIRAGLPGLQKIVYWRTKGIGRYRDPILLSLEDLMTLGKGYEASYPTDFEDSIRQGSNRDVAVQFLKLAGGTVHCTPVTHEFLLSFAQDVSSSLTLHKEKPPDYVAAMSPCWFFEQGLGYAVCLLTGQILNFPESRGTVNRDFREISPHVVVRPPQPWETVHAAINTHLRNSTWLKRTLCQYGLSIGYRAASQPQDGRRAGILSRSLHKGADLLVYGPLKDKHGLNRARVAYVAGGAVSEEAQRLFSAINLNLKQIYCSTKDGLVHTSPSDGEGLN